MKSFMWKQYIPAGKCAVSYYRFLSSCSRGTRCALHVSDILSSQLIVVLERFHACTLGQERPEELGDGFDQPSLK